MALGAGPGALIGREGEMSLLSRALGSALDGNGGLAMLVGDPGIGKTRLTQEVVSVAQDRGFGTAVGVCYEGGTTPPYWPWTQAIRTLLADPSEEILDAIRPRANAIQEIVPELGGMVPDSEPPPPLEPDQARFRLFDSVSTFLSSVAESHPIVIILDDLHWADHSTLDLLEFSAREVSSRKMLIVGSYRDMELSRRHPLSESLARLARIDGFQRIPLQGLEHADSNGLINDIGGMELPAELLATIHARTEGNPFFISEVVRDLVRVALDRGGDFDAVKIRVPEGVREAVGIRLNKLSEKCNSVLRTASVIGREFDFALLAFLNHEFSDDELLDLVDEAIAADAIREIASSAERYEFSHALIGQTLAEELSMGRRIRQHAQIVEAIETIHADHLEDHVAELAHHCAMAETVIGHEKLVRYSRMAGEQAANSYAWIDARNHFEHALEAIGDDESDLELAAILGGLGKAELLTLSYPDIQRGWDHVARSFEIYDVHEEHELATQVLIDSNGFLPVWVHGTADVYSRGVDIALAGSEQKGQLLVMLARSLRFDRMDHEGSSRAIDQALEIATRGGHKRLEAGVLITLGWLKEMAGDFSGAAETRGKALDLAIKFNYPLEEVWARQGLVETAIFSGEPVGTEQQIELVLSLQERFGFSTPILWSQHRLALLRGDYAMLERHRSIIEAEHADDSVNMLFAAIGQWHLDPPDDLDDRFQSAHLEAVEAPSLWQRAANLEMIMSASWVMNRPDDATRAADMVRTILSEPRLTPEMERSGRAAIAIADVITGNADGAEAQYRYLSTAPHSISGSVYMETRDRLLALLAHMAGLPDNADTHFEAALALSTKAGYRLDAVWVGYEYARVILDRIDHHPSGDITGDGLSKASSLIDQSLALAREVKSRPLDQMLLNLKEKVALLSRLAAAYPDRLTSREVEVIQMLAAGSTNQQIADDLIIALNTVTTHVANILSKTGSANRTEAAAYAIANDLVKD